MAIETITVRNDKTNEIMIQAKRRTEQPELSWHISGPIAPALPTIPIGTLAVMKQEVRRLARINLGSWLFTTTVEVSS